MGTFTGFGETERSEAISKFQEAGSILLLPAESQVTPDA